jgi:WD40 repeat protein/serine/threonine protein kinase/DNA-binding XRE family transcriptional regulator
MEQSASFGYWLRRRRKALDLTQDELARLVGCALGTIKKLETDERRPSREMAARLADCLRITGDDRAAFLKAARAELAADRLAPPGTPPIVTPDAQRTLHGYQLHELLGQGGFGAVYRATQPGVGRTVAIKIIRPDLASLPEFIRRFERETELIARLEHPHIVPLYDSWRDPSGAFLVMRYLDGGSLEAALQRGGWSIERVTHLLEQVGAALAFAHQQGVVHRDIKPANILLDRAGNAYLADFGIAKELRATPTDDTQPGEIVGSPDYSSPEQLRDEPVTAQSDIFSLGVLLATVLAGASPFAGLPPAERLLRQLAGRLAVVHADLPTALAVVLVRATAPTRAERYADVPSLMEAWRVALGDKPTEVLPAVTAAPDAATSGEQVAPKNPFKGLRAFHEADAADFFGREALVQRLLERLAEPGDGSWGMRVGDGDLAHTPQLPAPNSRFLAVVGPSGSGKSSVVRAGLIPALRRGGLDGSEQWFVVDLFPGAHPLEELEAALLRVAAQPAGSLLDLLREDERGLARAIKRILPANPATELVLVIDQFEELFTLTADAPIRAHVLRSLVALLGDPRSRARVIVTIRADFIDRPLQYAEFGALLRERTEFVLPLAPDELERAIVGPAERARLAIDSELVVAIESDVAEQPGALPLLQYALTELFERRQGATLTLAAYRASGGIRAALARRADELYDGLDRTGQAAARQLFLRLITLGEGLEDTRRRVLRSELIGLSNQAEEQTENREPGTKNRIGTGGFLVLGSPSAIEQAINRYGQARLLSFDHDPLTRAPTVEVAHEALLGAWGRLRGWLEASRADIRVQRLLAAAAAEWAAAERDGSYLLAGARLAQFEDWAARSDLALTPEERAFLDASLAERDSRAASERERAERELAQERTTALAQRSAAQRLRYLAIALTIFLLTALGLSALAFQQRQTATASATDANQQRQTAAANAAEADQQRGVAQASLVRVEAQRLGVESSRLSARGGNVDLAALLAIRSIHMQYTPQGDEAVEAAAQLPYPLYVLKGHTGRAWRVRFSPNDRYLLSGDNVGTARIWDVQTGQELRRIPTSHGTILDLNFSPDGTMIVLGYDESVATILSSTTGQQLQQLSGHLSAVWGATFTPDGRSVVTGSYDKTVRIWDAQTGQQLRKITAPQPIAALALSPDGKIIATGEGVAGPNSIRLWNMQTGAAIRTLSGHIDWLRRLDFSPDGTKLLSASTDSTVRIWDVATGIELLKIAEPDWMQSAAFAPDGHTFITAGNDKIVRLRDSATGRELLALNAHTDWIYGVAFAHDGRLVASASADGTARIWNIKVWPGLPQFVGHSEQIAGAALTSDGKTLATVSSGLDVKVWDTTTGAQRRTLEGLGGGGNGVAISPDSRLIAAGGSGNIVALWDLATGKQLTPLTTGNTVATWRVAFSANGRYMATIGWGGGGATVWEVQSRKQIAELFQPDGRPVAFSPDSTRLLTGGNDGYSRLWDFATNTLVSAFQVDGVEPISVAFTREGRPIAGSKAGIIQIWDPDTHKELRRFVGHIAAIQSLSVSPDGRYLLSASDDQTARLWDIQTGQELRRFVGHAGPVEIAIFTPDGRMVLTGSGDRTARLWYTQIDDTVKMLCSRLLRDLTPDERAQYGIADTAPTCPTAH